MPAGFDISDIENITFVMDRGLANGTNAGTIRVQTDGLAFTDVVTGDFFDAGAHTLFPGSPVVTAAGSNVNPQQLPGLIDLRQTSRTDFEFDYSHLWLSGLPPAG